jgi:hypothetical protein
MSEYPTGLGLARSLNLQHLTALQLHEARVGKVKGNGEPKHAIGVEELLRQPNMGQGGDIVRLELTMKALKASSR